jgi:hypothetical protein
MCNVQKRLASPEALPVLHRTVQRRCRPRTAPEPESGDRPPMLEHEQESDAGALIQFGRENRRG